jgi:YVTN family beta-propeller protein
LQILRVLGLIAAAFAALFASAAEFLPPGGERYPIIAAAGSILPGGRVLRPLGAEIETGPGPFNISIGPRGAISIPDIGYERFGVTVIQPPRKASTWTVNQIWARTPNSTAPEMADPSWRGVTRGIAFDSPKSLWASEGASGKIRLIDIDSSDPRKTISLNGAEWSHSFTEDLAFDNTRRLLLAVDRANFRVAVVDVKSSHVLSSVRTGGQPFALALAADGNSVWVANSDPDSLCAVDVHDPLKPQLGECVPVDSPQGVLAVGDRVYVSNARTDAVTVISARDRKIIAEIPLRIPSLETYRGIAPAGMAYDPVTKWLLVAEAGINSVGVIDTAQNMAIAHLPAGWMPTSVAISGDRVFVANALGRGTGPNLRRPLFELGEVPTLHRGMVTTFIMPDVKELPKQTGIAFVNNGFIPRTGGEPVPPSGIKKVVLIVRGGGTFDEFLGDVTAVGDQKVLSFPRLARFGMHGLAQGHKGQFSVQDAQVTPNLHAAARHWAFSDNFYADGETQAEGRLWVSGGYPDLRTENDLITGFSNQQHYPAPLWPHLERHKVSFWKFDEETETSDQHRADEFIAEAKRKYEKGSDAFPRFILLFLPNDRPSAARPDRGYPYDDVSAVEDNDLALGRIIEYLSHSPGWPEMAVFVTETGTNGELDHIDAHRTVLLAAGPYVRRNYVSHTNSSFPGLLRTVFKLLHVPPLNLSDATAGSLDDMFTNAPDLTPFTAGAPDTRIFDASEVKY